MNCDCCHPLECTVHLIFEQEKKLKFSAPERDLIKSCVITDQTVTDGNAGDPDIIGEGDLDALFGEDFVEEDTG